jgi:hypothetical protein
MAVLYATLDMFLLIVQQTVLLLETVLLRIMNATRECQAAHHLLLEAHLFVRYVMED